MLQSNSTYFTPPSHARTASNTSHMGERFKVDKLINIHEIHPFLYDPHSCALSMHVSMELEAELVYVWESVDVADRNVCGLCLDERRESLQKQIVICELEVGNRER